MVDCPPNRRLPLRAESTPEPLPLGSPAEIPGVGPMFYRSVPGPVDAPTVVLLHGWTSTAEVTWQGVYGAMSEHFSLVAPDLRGHGHGPKSGRRPRLRDAASDVASLLESLRVGPVILVGYSMGGAVAQIVARERPDLLRGLVVCASASSVCDRRVARWASTGLRAGSAIASAVPERALRLLAAAVMRAMFGNSDYERWARRRVSQHRWSEVLSLGADLVSFDSQHWVGNLDVPSAVVITTADRFVTPDRQHLLATALAARAVHVDGDHSVCLASPTMFAAALLRACRSVLRRTDRRPAAMRPQAVGATA